MKKIRNAEQMLTARGTRMEYVVKKRMSMIIHTPSVNVSIHVYLMQIVVQVMYVNVYQALLGAV